jgi:hypothetical protein
MRKKTIEKNLKKALLNDGIFAWALFEYELEEHLEEYLLSKRADRDKFFFAITEHTNDVAMLLIDENDQVHINEDARTVLKELWSSVYRENIRKLIPHMAEQLDAGYLFAAGVQEINWMRHKRGKKL